jgi:hypothetical protein
MNISYRSSINWLTQNWKVLVLAEIACLLLAGVYFATAPKIYEADFAMRVPKVQMPLPADPSKTQWQLLISGLDYMRGLRNPVGYSPEFIKSCYGVDSNAKRKEFINTTQMGLLNNGDTVQFSLRQEGKDQVMHCAHMLLAVVTSDLNGIFNRRMTEINAAGVNPTIVFEPPMMVQPIRVSDSYIRPKLEKVLVTAILAGLFLAIFGVSLRNKYRA